MKRFAVRRDQRPRLNAALIHEEEEEEKTLNEALLSQFAKGVGVLEKRCLKRVGRRW